MQLQSGLVLLYNAAKRIYCQLYTISYEIDKTQSYGGSPGLSPTVQLELISPSAGTGTRNSTILQSSENLRSCFGLVEGMAATWHQRFQDGASSDQRRWALACEHEDAKGKQLWEFL